jgi:hypothetical protein
MGMLSGEDLLACLIAHSGGGVCEALIMNRSDAATLLRAAHLLFHEFTQAKMQYPEIAAVTMDRECFPPNTSLSQFKRHAGYLTEDIQIAVVLHPAFRILLGNWTAPRMLRFLRVVTWNFSARFDSLEALKAASATSLPNGSPAK